MADLGSDIASVAGLAGTAISDLFSSTGDKISATGDTQSATSYTAAAVIAAQNEQLVSQAANIQEAQTTRSLFQTIGSERADVAGAGFESSGSSLDLLASSASQGALAKALIQTQGVITENAYAEQAGQYNAMASSALAAAQQAENSGNGATAAGLLSAAGAIGGIVNTANQAGLFSSDTFSSIGSGISDAASAVGSAASDAASSVGDFIGSLF